jgi:hypothetical protein
MGSGSTAVAALRAGRHFAGYDTDPEYVRGALARVAKERERATSPLWSDIPLSILPVKVPADVDENLFFQTRSVKEGRAAKAAARELLEACGFEGVEPDRKLEGGLELNFSAVDKNEEPWFFDVSGAFSSTRPGLKRTDTLWKALGKALVFKSLYPGVPFVLLTTDMPPRNSAGDAALQQVMGRAEAVADAIEMSDASAVRRLQAYAYKGYEALNDT